MVLEGPHIRQRFGYVITNHIFGATFMSSVLG